MPMKKKLDRPKKLNRSNKRTRKSRTNKSELKPTTCSNCRYKFDKSTDRECYKRHGLLSEQEYIDCVPAFVHWNENALAKFME